MEELEPNYLFTCEGKATLQYYVCKQNPSKQCSLLKGRINLSHNTPTWVGSDHKTGRKSLCIQHDTTIGQDTGLNTLSVNMVQ